MVAFNGRNGLAGRPRLAPLVSRPVLARAALDEEPPLSAGDKQRFDRIAEALVAKLDELPADAVEDGAQPPPRRRAPLATQSLRLHTAGDPPGRRGVPHGVWAP
jgi:hypothetical protein